MHSFSPVRIPKLELPAEQPSTGEGWIPSKKDTLHPRTKEKPWRGGRRGTITFTIKSQTLQRHSKGTNRTLCIWGPNERITDSHRGLSQTSLWVFECLLWRHGSAVTCRRDGGSGCSRFGRCSIWHKSSWRSLPLALVCHGATEQTAHKLENNCTKEFLTLLWKF